MTSVMATNWEILAVTGVPPLGISRLYLHEYLSRYSGHISCWGNDESSGWIQLGNWIKGLDYNREQYSEIA
jgi:hypothetical protein